MKRLIIILTLPLFLVACGAAVTELPQPPNRGIEKMLGQEYALKTIQYPGGVSRDFDSHDFTFRIKSSKIIEGRITCNEFQAETLWGQNNTLYLSNFISSDKKNCKAAPLELEEEMDYILAGRSIILQSKKFTWRAAIFERVSE